MAAHIRGIPECQKNLSDFPKLLVMNCFRVALGRAIAVFEAEVRARTPESDYSTSSEEYGHLIDNLMSTVTIDTQARGGRAVLSFGRKGFLAVWLEFGHRKVTHKGREIGSVAAKPFMRQSFETASEAALDAFTETVKDFMGQDSIKAAA